MNEDLRKKLEAVTFPDLDAMMEAYAAAGFDRAVHWLPSAGRGTVERALDAWESAIAEFAGCNHPHFEHPDTA